MTNSFTCFDYPIVIRQELNYIVFSVPDFHISVACERHEGQFTPKYIQELALTLARTWSKVHEQIKRMKTTRMKLPPPSKPKQVFQGEDQVLAMKKAAKLAGVSEDTLARDADRGKLPCSKTPGGHRKFLESHILDYKESRTIRKQITRGEIDERALGHFKRVGRRSGKRPIEVFNQEFEKFLETLDLNPDQSPILNPKDPIP